MMEYIGESSAIYYWRALGLIVSVLILYVVFEMQKKKMSRLSSAIRTIPVALKSAALTGSGRKLSFTVSACRRSIYRRGSIISR